MLEHIFDFNHEACKSFNTVKMNELFKKEYEFGG